MSTQDMLALVYKTLICYFFLILILKWMGKREIGKVSTFDIVVFFVISELFSLSMNDPSSSILHSLIPIILIVLLQLLTAFLSLKSDKIRSFVEGKITFIIYKGEINQKEMKKQRYNIDDLFSQLRAQNIELPSDVEFAILEDTGSLTIMKKEECQLADPEPLIKDGKWSDDVLKRLSLSKEEALKQIQEQSLLSLEEIFIAVLRKDGTFFLLPKKKG